MSTTLQQDRNFAERMLEIVKESLTGDYTWVLDWVAANFGPEDVFGDRPMEAYSKSWAEENGYSLKEE